MESFHLVDGPIDPDRHLPDLADEAFGAVVTFAGVVRRHEGEVALRAIDYEAYAAMARREARALLQEAHERFGPLLAVVVHRTGEVPVGEAAVWIGVATGHRAEAFDAARFLIDELKARVPIWKRNHLPVDEG